MISVRTSKLSIITITYKEPLGLDKTLASLQKLGELKNWESLVIDSSPSENSVTLEKYRNALPIKHISCKPEGIYQAINKGVEAATGDLLWILNGGDCVFSEDNLMQIIEKFESDSELDLVCGTARLFKNGNYQYTKNISETFINNLIGGNGICQQACIYRRKTLLELGFFSTSLKLASDYEHHFAYYTRHKKVLCSSVALVDYDMDGSSKNYRDVFGEYKLIHRELKNSLPITIKFLNGFFRRVNFIKIYMLKQLARSPLSQWLRPLWLSWNRRSQ